MYVCIKNRTSLSSAAGPGRHSDSGHTPVTVDHLPSNTDTANRRICEQYGFGPEQMEFLPRTPATAAPASSSPRRAAAARRRPPPSPAVAVAPAYDEGE